MGLSNAERQRRWRERRKEQQPAVQYRKPKDRRSRPARWRDAVQTLVELQAEYQDWLDGLPPNLEGSTVAEKLQDICGHDFGDLEALEPPRGFGRDCGGDAMQQMCTGCGADVPAVFRPGARRAPVDQASDPVTAMLPPEPCNKRVRGDFRPEKSHKDCH